ncbi:hypothetical protein BFV65_04925 [Enterobacter hormaechei subsp. hoffmannii]|nr:hypothetical protein BFV65_04925 [Enterobacter hormaechei subsp. hoffmannii]
MLLYPFHMPDQGMEFARQMKNFLSLNDIVIACNSLSQNLKKPFKNRLCVTGVVFAAKLR